MKRYKTAVTDYEGMQGVLDTHAEQGWELFSLTPDTWRRSLSENSDLEQSPFEELATQNRGTRDTRLPTTCSCSKATKNEMRPKATPPPSSRCRTARPCPALTSKF